MSDSLIFICGIIVFLVGFTLGRKVGFEEGIKIGLNKAPLELKRRSLEKGECVICGTAKKIQDHY